MDGKGYIYLENQAFSTVNLPHSTITQTSCNFSPLLIFEFGSIPRSLAGSKFYIFLSCIVMKQSTVKVLKKGYKWWSLTTRPYAG